MLIAASLTDPIVNFAVDLVDSLGLFGVFVLMLLESASIPIPSEATMLFAGFNVSKGEYSLIAVTLVGTFANLCGSWLAYAVGYYGRVDILEKHGRTLRIKPSHLAAADRYFERYGDATVFFARMVPIIRTFISLPAGVARMPLLRFSVLTFLGCLPWVFMLAFIGTKTGANWDQWKDSLHYVDYAVVAMIVVGVVYLTIRRRSDHTAAPIPTSGTAHPGPILQATAAPDALDVTPDLNSSASEDAHVDGLRGALADAIEKAIAAPEFARDLASRAVGVSEGDLRLHLQTSEQDIWGAIDPELRVDAQAQHELMAARARATRPLRAALRLLVALGAIAFLDAVVLGGWPLTTDLIVWLGAVCATVTLLAWLASWVLRGGAASRDAEHRANTARTQLLDTMHVEGVMPIARDLFPQASWELSMERRSAPGLAELSSTRYEVSTRSRDEIRSVLMHLRGGAVGVAGPRGAGKTTLIESVCSGRTSVVAGPHVGLSVTAPVHYDARDFIVHLLTRVCETVIDNPRALEMMRRAAFRDIASLNRRRIGRLLWGFAAFLSIAAIAEVLGVDVSVDDHRAAFLAALASTVGLLAYVISSRDLTTGVGALGVPDQGGRILTALSARRYQWSRALRRAFRTSSRGESALADAEQNRAVVERALELYRETKFQQSYTSGWSGKLPLGIGLGGDSRMSLAQAQMSLPEMVNRLREFLSLVVTTRRTAVIVGIDELDKIADIDDARGFLNGIKAMFGVPGVYFLVSVSEDAMSSFERRGLPFRDVFDSSFDEIVRARYLTLAESQRLLRRRIIGMPASFHALCHCLAGGLPRDVIRVARSLVRELQTDTRLSELSTRLVAAELKEKIHGTTVALRSCASGSDRDGLLAYLTTVENLDLCAESLSQTCMTFRAKMVAEASEVAPSMSGEQSCQGLAKEINAFAYFCAMLLRLFGSGTSHRGLGAAAQRGDFEQLARVRQDLSVDDEVAWRRLADLRRTIDADTHLGQAEIAIVERPPAAHTSAPSPRGLP